MLARAAGLRRAARVGDPGPEQPGGPELGDGQEPVLGGGVAEVELREGLFGGQSRVGEGAQAGHAGGEGEAQLLGGGGARLVVARGVGDQGAQPGRPAAGVLDGQRVRRPYEPGMLLARGGLVPQRVGAETAAGRGVPAGGVAVEQGAGGLGELGAGVEHHRRQVQVDAAQHPGRGARPVRRPGRP